MDANARCENCRFWNRKESNDYRALPVRRCMATPQMWDATTYAEDGNTMVMVEEFADSTAFANDGSTYSASLLTLPNHGCTMFQPMEEEANGR